MTMRHFTVALALSVLAWVAPAQAFELETKQVTDKVYALVGDIDQRTKENLGLNNTLGCVVTDDGVVLVGSGGYDDAAKLIEAAVKKVTDKPIKQVINTGSQDHHWMGNGYFIEQKIPVMALKKTVDSQEAFKISNLQRLATSLEKKPEDFQPVAANDVVDADTKDFSLGGVDFSLRYLGEAHFPGDAVLWLPKEKVLFTGDIVFNDRLLGLLPETSKVKAWLATFNKMAELKPEHVVPGHGYPSDWATAQKSTGDYLDWLVTEVGKALADMEDLGDAVKRLSADNRFEYLKFAKEWNGRNVHQTYMQMEAE
jgi:glyoxylase-like metal-dependent hydrolase (beta-lactamase superfamily II)